MLRIQSLLMRRIQKAIDGSVQASGLITLETE
jgi:hypothetical protein